MTSATLASSCGETSPAAWATPGSARTSSNIAAGTVARLPLLAPLTTWFSKITASVLWVDFAAAE